MKVEGSGYMGTSLKLQEDELYERVTQGRYHKVAVLCWFTSTGKAMPKAVKFEDEEKCLQMINQIEILRTDEKHYSGILRQRYDCSAVINERIQRFTLLYHPGENTWDMVILK